MTRHLLLPLLCAAPLWATAKPLPLQEVLRQAGDGGGYAAANAEMDARYAARDQRESEAGWQMFGNANVGRYRELVTEDLRNDYYGRSFAVGVRYPLLGALRRQVDAVHAADRDARFSDMDRSLQRAQQRLALRSAYADWWRATQEQALCAGVQDAEQSARQQVQQRLDGKWILPSDARLMHSEWSAVSRRCAGIPGLLDDTRASLESLGVQLQPGDQPVASELASQPKRLRDWQALLDDNPRMAQRRNELATAEQNRDRPWYSAIDSYFTLAQTREERSGASDSGSGLSAGITLSAPVDFMDYGSARNREGKARFEAASRALENQRGQLLRELGQVLERQRRALDEYTWRSERRDAVQRIIGERRQRGALDSGEASLRLLQAEVDNYNAGFAQISAWHGAWVEDSALRLFGDDSPAFAALLGGQMLQWQGSAGPEQASPDQAGWTQGAYIWDSAALLDATQRPAQLSALAQAGISQLNVSLDKVQVSQMSTTLPALRALVEQAHRRSMRVNLLLGDPAWIKPSQRGELTELIARLREVPFDGLHLDLEVEQLGWPVPDQRLRDWLATLQAAHQASPWPLMISSHPRWFSEEARRQPCVPCALPAAGVSQVSLMIYTRNPTSSSQRIAAIARQWPALHLRLAQSIEPDQPADLSWADASHDQLQRQASDWREQLAPAHVGGIDWQSWTYYPRAR